MWLHYVILWLKNRFLASNVRKKVVKTTIFDGFHRHMHSIWCKTVQKRSQMAKILKNDQNGRKYLKIFRTSLVSKFTGAYKVRNNRVSHSQRSHLWWFITFWGKIPGIKKWTLSTFLLVYFDTLSHNLIIENTQILLFPCLFTSMYYTILMKFLY